MLMCFQFQQTNLKVNVFSCEAIPCLLPPCRVLLCHNAIAPKQASCRCEQRTEPPPSDVALRSKVKCVARKKAEFAPWQRFHCDTIKKHNTFSVLLYGNVKFCWSLSNFRASCRSEAWAKRRGSCRAQGGLRLPPQVCTKS